MAILKCKMCGGDIILSEDKTFGTCDSCGRTMPFPKVSDEHKLNLYNRANHFRRQNEFDKAIAAYDKILDQDDTDAEAHWGAVLSRYGIEYVEDPATHERIPTCHRVQAASILSDPDYLSALEYAPDTASRDIYEQEARRIAEIQKGILAISSQEKPYDVFICYKETDEAGQRTRDSALAQEIYYQLTNEGYKVFFSRITLEDKLGQEYEPYIFAALNSARVMLVIGTKPEFFNAVWVKNEWSRYLALMKQDRTRLLIPCYRDMDPYDLPEELSALQSQDMSKIGFIQDITRGIKKVLSKPESKPQPIMQQASAATTNIDNLMKRARLFMEDGDFTSANEYLDKVLDENAEYAPAYVGKVCTALGFRKETELAEATFLYAEHPDWKKALRFATPQQKATYEEYYEQVKARVARQIRDLAYDCAMEMAVNPKATRKELEQAKEQYLVACNSFGSGRANGSRWKRAAENEPQFQKAVSDKEPGNVKEENYRMAAEMFQTIGDAEAVLRAKECLSLAELARMKVVYDQAKIVFGRHPNAVEMDKLADQFLSIADYKDARTRAEDCRISAENDRKKLYESALEAMKEAGNESSKWKNVKNKLSNTNLNGYKDIDDLRKNADLRYQECVTTEEEEQRQAWLLAERKAMAAAAKKRRNIILFILLLLLAVGAYFAVTLYVIPSNNYKAALTLQQSGKYEEAIEAFEALEDFSDSKAKIIECQTAIKEQAYQEAKGLQESGQYEEAIAAFTALGDYSDSKAKIIECQTAIKERAYQEAKGLLESGQYEEAIAAFTALADYSDSKAKIVECQNSINEQKYQKAKELRKAGKYVEAIAAFTALGNYSNSVTELKETKYRYAEAMIEAKDYVNAYIILSEIKGYRNVDSLLQHKKLREPFLNAKYAVGNYVNFGHYPQTSAGNDSTEIEWLVLSRDGNKAMLISRYGLDTKQYNEKYVDITWGKCTLRTWLNGTFLNKAFTAQEQKGIVLTNVGNGTSQGYSSTSGGNNTQDKIFLLSYAEANKYFGVQHYSVSGSDKNTKSRVAPTAYAIEQGADTSSSYKTADGSAAGWWWLRSPGDYQDGAALVLSDGSLSDGDVNYFGVSVRPALWVNLESDIF